MITLMTSPAYLAFCKNRPGEEINKWFKIIRLSPVAWQHINLIGKYEFYSDKECLNLQKVIQNLIANEKIDLLATT
jgi:hypothetical protein